MLEGLTDVCCVRVVCVCVWEGGGGEKRVSVYVGGQGKEKGVSVCVWVGGEGGWGRRYFPTILILQTTVAVRNHHPITDHLNHPITPSPITPPQVVKKNSDEREEALNTPMDGYELFNVNRPCRRASPSASGRFTAINP